MCNDAEVATPSDNIAFLRYLGRHLVSLSGTYQVREGANWLEDRPYNYSGTVVSHDGTWYILTVGHAIGPFLAAVQSGQVRITGRVLGHAYGVGAQDDYPIPFDIVETPSTHRDESEAMGLDYAILKLAPMWKRIIAENGILAFPFRVQAGQRPAEEMFLHYYVIGFPEERVSISLSARPRTGITVQPHCIPLRRMEDAATGNYPRLQATVTDLGDLDRIVGMSGGPIIGLVKRGDEHDAYLWGIQSAWLPGSRVVFGCLLDAIFADAEPWLAQQQAAATEE